MPGHFGYELILPAHYLCVKWKRHNREMSAKCILRLHTTTNCKAIVFKTVCFKGARNLKYIVNIDLAQAFSLLP